MKRFTLVITAMLLASVSFAQSAADALAISQVQYEGTARTMAMGNAFTALGGDLGALAVNPASSAVFRNSQFSLTPDFITSKGSSNYLGKVTNERSTDLAMSNAGFVFTFDTGNYTGLLNFNLGFALNRTCNFNSIMGACGSTAESSMLGSLAAGLSGVSSTILESSDGGSYNPYYDSSVSWPSILAWNTYVLAPVDDAENEYIASTENIDGKEIYIGGMLNQDYFRKVSGGKHEFTVNFGANVSDILFLGVNLNLLSVNYEVNEYYSEVASNPGNFQDGFCSVRSNYWQNTTGSGVNAKIGAILTPLAGLRIGAALTTRTRYNLTDHWINSMTTAFNNNHTYSEESPEGVYNYLISAPMRFNLGAAYTLGTFGLVSVDYETFNNGGIILSDGQKSQFNFRDENDYISQRYGRSNIIRAGAEVWPVYSIALRAGYNYYGTPGDGYEPVKIVSGGIGFKFGSQGKSNFDIAYQAVLGNSENFALYNDYGPAAPVGTITRKTGKLAFTYSLKF